MICNNDHFWLNKFERDFPLNIKSNTYITNKQAYLSIYNENFDLFKSKMKMYKLDNFDLINSLELDGEVSLYTDKLAYPYIIDNDNKYMKFQLIEDLFIAVRGIYPYHKHLYPNAKYLIVENIPLNRDINTLVESGEARGVTNLNELDLSEYKYVTTGSYYQPSEMEIIEWTMLGFIYRV